MLDNKYGKISIYYNSSLLKTYFSFASRRAIISCIISIHSTCVSGSLVIDNNEFEYFTYKNTHICCIYAAIAHSHSVKLCHDYTIPNLLIWMRKLLL